MKPRHKRFALILGGLVGITIAATLILSAFRSNLVFFFSPSDLANGKAPREESFRLGGLVEKGSLARQADGLTVSFVLTDNVDSVKVIYKGLLPDMFKEGQGAVAMGRLTPDGTFQAQEVLAKHDEKYMPPDVARALEQADKAKNKSNVPVTMN